MIPSEAFLAPRMSAVQESPTAAVSVKARRLVAAGRPVINLGEGELDFDTPDHVKEAGIRAIQTGQTKYTAVSGTPELKEAIRAKFQRENGLDYRPEQIIAGTGAKQILFNALLATVAAGDEVIVPAPYWVSYPDMTRIAGGTPVIVAGDEGYGFKPRPGDLAAAITPRTKWLVLNSPNNPSGAVYSASELRDIADVLLDNEHVMVLSDDVYEHIVYGERAHTLAEIEPRLIERTLTVNGVSKVFSMTGWRLGYAGGPAWLVRAIDILQSQSTSNPNSISQAAATTALNGSLDYFSQRMERLRLRRDHVVAALEKTSNRLRGAAPDGAFYVYANCQGMIGATTPSGRTIGSDIDAVDYFLDAADVAMVPGSAFGLSPYLRIAYAVDEDTLATACNRLVAACSQLS
ncbi:pyridoxal phosphate-dependent aminotransferase [Shumkonia mesophila]|uniref:pyridoxal phosphate-dependent aminotransferase n=1 Tax=Shumkonia mesophila TaxID=2838854 RepID=UPI0029352621|nr:pyridoxal phosphate-dependent aminotransferase [Shumkonia mesophila]